MCDCLTLLLSDVSCKQKSAKNLYWCVKAMYISIKIVEKNSNKKWNKIILLGAKLLYEFVCPSWLWLWFLRYDFYVFFGGFTAFKETSKQKYFFTLYSVWCVYAVCFKWHLLAVRTSFFSVHCFTMVFVFSIFGFFSFSLFPCSFVCMYIYLLC